MPCYAVRAFPLSACALALLSGLPALLHAAPLTASSRPETPVATAAATTPPEAERITVVATGNERATFSVPAMVSVIEGASASAQTAASPLDALRQIPGLTLSGAGRLNGQDVMLRGYDRRGVLTLVDGVRQGTDTGHLNGVFLDPALIKRVEVVRGPGAMLYGSGALGGVIAYQSADAADLLPEGENQGYRLFTTLGSGDHSLGMGAGAFARSETLDGLLAWSARDRGDIRQGGGFATPGAETLTSLQAKGRWYADSAQTLSGELRYFNDAAREPKNPQSAVAADLTEDSNPRSRRSTLQRDAQLRYDLRPEAHAWLNASTQLYWSEVRINTLPDGGSDEYRAQTTRGARLENRSRLLADSPLTHQLTYGGEYYRQQQAPGGETKGFPQAKIDFASGWLQDEIALRTLPVALVLGTRYDHYSGSSRGYADVNAHKWSSRAALTLTPIDELMLFASWAQAFRAPTMGEMYNDSLHFAIGSRYSNFWVPNPHLRPETNATQEYGFGLQFHDLLLAEDSVELKASYFSTRAKDYIATQVDFAKGMTWSENIPHSTIWGWDATLSWATRWFRWDLAWNRTSAKDDDTQQWLSTSTPDTWRSELAVPLGARGFSVGWNSAFARAANKVSSSDRPQGGYSVHDFYLRYQPRTQAKGLSATLMLSNAFDKRWFTPQGVPQEGRNARLYLSYQF